MPSETTEQAGRAEQPRKTAAPAGITVHHSRACNTHNGGSCNRSPIVSRPLATEARLIANSCCG